MQQIVNIYIENYNIFDKFLKMFQKFDLIYRNENN